MTKADVEKIADKISFIDNKFDIGGTVCEFIVIDINLDNKDDLLYTYDISGRLICETLTLILDLGNEIQGQWFGHFGYNNLQGHIVDLNNDKLIEIIVPETIADPGGLGNPKAFWPSVYKWDGEKYIKADEEFPEFYKKVLIPVQEARIKEIESSEVCLMPEFSKELEKEYKNFEQIKKNKDKEPIKSMIKKSKEYYASYEYLPLFKAQRLLGIDKKAGLKKAKEWMKSDIRELKENAIVVFEDIGDEESIEQIKNLENDKDRFISERAKRAFNKIKKGDK